MKCFVPKFVISGKGDINWRLLCQNRANLVQFAQQSRVNRVFLKKITLCITFTKVAFMRLNSGS